MGATLSYSDMKALIMGSVDKVTDAADKTITGGRLNMTAAVLALSALMTQRGIFAPPPSPPAAATSPPPSGGSSSPLSASPALLLTPPGSASAATRTPPFAPTAPNMRPVCGTTGLKGQPANQSSTASGGYSVAAGNAVDGNCSKRRISQGSCAQTREFELQWEWVGWWAGIGVAPVAAAAPGTQFTAHHCSHVVTMR